MDSLLPLLCIHEALYLAFAVYIHGRSVVADSEEPVSRQRQIEGRRSV